mgnify:FL=1
MKLEHDCQLNEEVNDIDDHAFDNFINFIRNDVDGATDDFTSHQYYRRQLFKHLLLVYDMFMRSLVHNSVQGALKLQVFCRFIRTTHGFVDLIKYVGNNVPADILKALYIDPTMRERYIESIFGNNTQFKRIWLAIVSSVAHVKENYTQYDSICDGRNMIEELKEMFNSAQDFLTDDTIKIFETIILTFVSLKNIKNVTGAVSVILTSIKALWPERSLCSNIKTYLIDYIFHGLKEEYNTLYKRNTSSGVAYENQMEFNLSRIIENFSLFKDSKLIPMVKKTLLVLVSLGMCKMSSIDFSIRGFKIFEPASMRRLSNLGDIVEAIYEIVTFFIEGASTAFSSGKLSDFLNGGSQPTQMDEEYAVLHKAFILIQNGNLGKIEGIDMEEHEFHLRVIKLMDKIAAAKMNMNQYEKALADKRYYKLQEMEIEYQKIKLACGIRKAPFAVQIYGGSGVGKSSVNDIITDCLLLSQGLSMAKESRCNLDCSKKHWDEWKSNIVAVCLDDFANAKPTVVEGNPTDIILRLCNNMSFTAPKADLHEKNSCFVEPLLVTATTNVLNLDSASYSNEPESIQRRFHYILDVKVKDQFKHLATNRLCPHKVARFYTDESTGLVDIPIIPDLWNIDVKHINTPGKDKATCVPNIVMVGDKKMEKLSLADVTRFLVTEFGKHDKQQEEFLVRSNKQKTMELCPHKDCNLPTCLCTNESHKCHQSQNFFMPRSVTEVGMQVNEVLRQMNEYGDYTNVQQLLSPLRSGLISHHSPFTRALTKVAMFFGGHYISYKYRNIFHICKCSLLLLGSIAAIKCNISSLIFIPMFAVLLQFGEMCLKDIMYERIANHIDEKQQVFAAIASNIRERHRVTITKSVIALGGLYAFIKIHKMSRTYKRQSFMEKTPENKVYHEQTLWQDINPFRFSSKTREESGDLISETIHNNRDKQSNPWVKVNRIPVPASVRSMTTTPVNFVNVLQKTLHYAEMRVPHGTYKANILFINSNICLIPQHYFTKDKSFSVTCVGKEHTFETYINVYQSVRIGQKDMRLCFSPNGGSFPNLIDYFPKKSCDNHPIHQYWRKDDKTLTVDKAMAFSGVVRNALCDFQGHYYTLQNNTFNGLCGAINVSQTTATAITGVHVGGMSNTPRGISVEITQPELIKAIQELNEIDGVNVGGSEGVFPVEVLNTRILTNQKMSIKSPLKFLDCKPQFKYYGSCIGGSTSKSTVRPSFISDNVYKICGVPNTWSGPKMNPEWFGWRKCLSVLSQPARPFPATLLLRAIQDYKEPIVHLIRNSEWKSIKPLSQVQTINGIPGMKFIDKMNMDTSIGFPLTGAKTNYIVDLEPDEVYQEKQTFVPEIMEEIERVLDTYKRGERAYCTMKGCKKDEVLPSDKEKCRIFYGAPISLTYLIRKYFLPIVRIMQMNPLLSECAVGINAHSDEWDKLFKFIRTHGDKNIFAGDYSKYDQRMPTQLIIAALRILIDFAKECDYTNEDITIMRAMVSDISSPFIAFNGDLLQLIEGGHISGNSLTVIINGIAGSLNLRCGYFHFYPRELDSFRHHVSIMTYGDDNAGSVSKSRKRFNIRDFSAFLSEYGQTYTMPDKESKLVPYMSISDTEFLKRKSVYHAALGYEIGALSETSIMKMLHNHVWSQERSRQQTMESASAQNIGTALSEWFNHGPEIYEQRRLQMSEIAEISGIDYMCKDELKLTYDERAMMRRNK